MENPFEVLAQRLDRIEELLVKLTVKSEQPAPLPQQNKYIKAQEAAEILHISKQTLYTKIKSIPHVKRFGQLYFIKEDLLEYIENGLSQSDTLKPHPKRR
ncbi:helix-turn-helix domain-containing protein [Siphonobacter sp. SORGH_AS_0500]|uniref:helix-turn-helix domain-containing protein n=1 Tax=Siphonobacter sp. SORGH_AS_0500 TaxID=1864824 RepID=UPI00285E8DD0|nr:helix-turn-helix domain-containing protein [Siphonobacter sp. SORGH_AS_0500]MDR6194906.1 putative DNA-binding transcriptional regulator AlpA [Siphonobacter sp. SORGH_AS_0500]